MGVHKFGALIVFPDLIWPLILITCYENLVQKVSRSQYYITRSRTDQALLCLLCFLLGAEGSSDDWILALCCVHLRTNYHWKRQHEKSVHTKWRCCCKWPCYGELKALLHWTIFPATCLVILLRRKAQFIRRVLRRISVASNVIQVPKNSPEIASNLPTQI